MTECASTSDSLQWLGWVISLILGVVGAVATIFVLWVRLVHAERLAKIKDRHDAIDKSTKALNDFEDITLSYWTEKDSKYTKAHLIIAHQRLIVCVRQLSTISNQAFPSADIATLRRYSTMDMEIKKRPVSASSDRIVKLTIAIAKLSASDLLQKKWVDASIRTTLFPRSE